MEETALDLREIWNANRDLGERIAKEKLSVDYDDEFDIFMLTIGAPKKAIVEELPDGLQLRIDPETMKISAFEIMAFQRHYLRRHPDFGPCFSALFPKPPSHLPTNRAEPAREAARKLAALPA